MIMTTSFSYLLTLINFLVSAITDHQVTTGTVLSRQNSSSEQPPPNMAAANFVAATSMGEGCALNGTAISTVLIDQ